MKPERGRLFFRAPQRLRDEMRDAEQEEGREPMKFMMRTTNEYERLVQFFVKNGLEFDGDEEVDADIVEW